MLDLRAIVGQRKLFNDNNSTTATPRTRWSAPLAGLLVVCIIPLACSVLLLSGNIGLVQAFARHLPGPFIMDLAAEPRSSPSGKRVTAINNNNDDNSNGMPWSQLERRIQVTREHCFNYQVHNPERANSLESVSRQSFIETVICLKLALWRLLFLFPEGLIPKYCCNLDIFRFFKICKTETTPKPAPTEGPAPGPQPPPASTTKRPRSTKRPQKTTTKGPDDGSTTTTKRARATTTTTRQPASSPSPSSRGSRSGLDDGESTGSGKQSDDESGSATTLEIKLDDATPAPSAAPTATPSTTTTTTTTLTNEDQSDKETTAEPKKKHHNKSSTGHKRD